MTASILLVMADPDHRENWKEFLDNQGYHTVAIAAGERVLDLCSHLQPDLVLLDAGLPDVPALEVCRRIKNDPRNRFSAVILVQGVLRGESSAAALHSAEADDVWEASPTRWEALTRIQSIVQLKSYIDKQAEAVVVSLARTIEARDTYTRGHCERLATSAVRLAMKLGLPQEQVDALRVAGMIHDVGKVAVPDAVLLKAGPLTAAETEIIRRHPVEGERICAPLKSLRRVLPIVRHHHERMDGSGYPDGLRGDAIPLAARILQIVDVYDALTTDRPYRQAYTDSEAVAILYDEADRGWLDRELVRIFAPVAAAPKGTLGSDVFLFEKLRQIS